ncbi:hypothetical protein PF011_g15891 [Phytophthora fragariae]|uniref:Uncharacterized protein n=1 Tax=Phytophthora fragariae TaxID=53985 RepID=A0A6A3JT32_9STRA|nr:hypothetical protein PF011_g15891 [Phytophthora fragariae]
MMLHDTESAMNVNLFHNLTVDAQAEYGFIATSPQ